MLGFNPHSPHQMVPAATSGGLWLHGGAVQYAWDTRKSSGTSETNWFRHKLLWAQSVCQNKCAPREEAPWLVPQKDWVMVKPEKEGLPWKTPFVAS